MAFDIKKIDETRVKVQNDLFNETLLSNSKERISSLYNDWNGTQHKSFPGFFTPYRSALEFGLEATLNPVLTLIGLGASCFFLGKILDLTSKGIAIIALVASIQQACFGGVNNSALLLLKITALAVAAVILTALVASLWSNVILPLFQISMGVRVGTRAISTVLEYINPASPDACLETEDESIEYGLEFNSGYNL